MQGIVFLSPVRMQTKKKAFQGADQDNQVTIFSTFIPVELDGHGNGLYNFSTLKSQDGQQKADHYQPGAELAAEAVPVDPPVKKFDALGDDGGTEKHSKPRNFFIMLHLQDRPLNNIYLLSVVQVLQQARQSFFLSALQADVTGGHAGCSGLEDGQQGRFGERLESEKGSQRRLDRPVAAVEDQQVYPRLAESRQGGVDFCRIPGLLVLDFRPPGQQFFDRPQAVFIAAA